jgi:hypothetical protein
MSMGEATTCLGVDERRAGRKRGTGRWSAFVLKATQWRRAKGRGEGALRARPRGGGRRRRGGGGWRGGRQRGAIGNDPRPLSRGGAVAT